MRAEPLRTGMLVALASVGSFLLACGDGGETAASGAAQQSPATSAGASPAAKEAPPQVKACSVVTRAEVEALISQKVLDPAEETIGELSICSFGDPASPQVAGRSLSRPVILSVFTAGRGYYAGAVAQASDLYEMVEKNAGEVDAVSGLGDKAHWTGTTVRILRGTHMVEVEVYAGDASRAIAEKLAAIALGRLR
jgi:hypothetical protein